jgi:DNA processing protein
MKARVISSSDEEWPRQLDELGPYRVPEEMNATGLPLRCGQRTVAIVGTRTPSAAGLDAATRLAGGLAEAGFTIVSGLAVGIDAAAHKAALDAGGYTVAVVGCGLDVDYPKRNSFLRRQIIARGTVISEYREGTPPTTFTFPERNRIIAGLSTGIVVVEGGDRSGALITARIGLDANRSIFAVPGSIRNPMAAGPNELIRTSQAAAVTDVKHICEELAPDQVWNESTGQGPMHVELEECEKDVLALMDDRPLSGDEVCRRLGHPPGRVALALSRLEVRNLIHRRRTGYEVSTAGARAKAALFV